MFLLVYVHHLHTDLITKVQKRRLPTCGRRHENYMFETLANDYFVTGLTI